MTDTARDIADGIMAEHYDFWNDPISRDGQRRLVAIRDAIAAALTAYGDARLVAEHRRGIELAEHLDKVTALAAAEVKRANEAEAALAKLRERHPEPEGVVEEPPRDNAPTDAW